MTSKKKIPLNILLLGMVSFLNDLSSEMIMPILPMFITALGGTSIAVGLVGGLRDSIASILKIFGGHWSDKTGKRKIFVLSGYFISSIFKIFLAFSNLWHHVLIFIGLERVGKGIRTAPRDAIISDSMSSSRGKSFGIHRTLDTLGAISGSLIVFLLIWFTATEYKSIILTAGIIAFSSIIPLYFVREKRKLPQQKSLKISLFSLSKPLKLFILISGIFAIANFSYMFFILRAKEVFAILKEGPLSAMPDKTSIGIPILLYILFNIFYAGLSTPVGILSDKIGRKKILIIGYILFSFTALGFALIPIEKAGSTIISFIILFALYGIVYAIVDGNQRAFVSDLSTTDIRATALGTFHSIIGFAALPGSFIAGFLWENISPVYTFIFGAVVSLTAAGLFLLFTNYFREDL